MRFLGRAGGLLRPLAVIVAAGLLATGCGDTETSLRPNVALIVHRGDAGVAQVLRDMREAVFAAASRGARLEVYLLDSGSAASMWRVDLSEQVNHGDLVLTGGNQTYRDAEARRYTQLVMAQLEPFVTEAEASDTGADLLGAVLTAIDVVQQMGAGDGEVVVVTGGGVHRTTELDLVRASSTPDTAADLAGRAGRIDLPPGVRVEVWGVGRFEGAANPVDGQFAQGVKTFWEVWCAPCVFR